MKKDFLWSLMAIMIAITMSVSFISCNDDDDNNISHDIDYVSALTGIIDRESGLRLKSLGDYTVYYNSEGLFDSIAHTDDYLDDYAFRYGPDKITYTHGYFFDISRELSVKYNKSGWMSSYESKETGDWSPSKVEAYWNGTGTATFTYDDEGHLTSITRSGAETGLELKGPYTSSWLEEITLTWENGLLKEMKYNETGFENARTWSGVYTFSYDTEYVNKYKQWVYIYIFGQYNDIFLPYLGLLGVGPDKLPSTVIFTFTDKYGKVGDSGTETYPCSYEFNADGSVAKANGWEYTYEYATGSKTKIHR